MEIQILPTLILPTLPDARHSLGGGVALLAGLAVITLGVVLPVLRSTLDGRSALLRGGCVELGPRPAPIVSEPARPLLPASVPDADPPRRARPVLWRYLTGCGAAWL